MTGALFALILLTGAASAQMMTPFKQAVAAAAADDKVVAAFYKQRKYKSLWTGAGDRGRRKALLAALAKGHDHGLPMRRYDPAAIKSALAGAKGGKARGTLDVQITKQFLQYARDIQSGALVPSRVDSEIDRFVPLRDPLKTLVAFSKSSPAGFLKSLPPKHPEYIRLMKVKRQLEQAMGKGGFGNSVKGTAKAGQSGNTVVALRNRLIRMGYLGRNASKTYDARMVAAVQQFQQDHGISPDGEAGPTTMASINISAKERLQRVLVALERRRWMNMPLGDRHILVNIAAFEVYIVDKGRVTFQTRSVVGKNDGNRRTPEFSDRMTHMVINPSWYVPRSIATKEYLPMLQRNRGAVKHLEMRNASGKIVNKQNVNFSQYTEKTFPYSFRQPPSRGNALGLVKYMFPNKHAIYLHDTPAKALFSRHLRAYSHGCVRLHKPFEFGYALLGKQMNDPEGYFKRTLATQKENRVNLKQPVPVHLDYRTVWVPAKGQPNYREDIYGRDAKIFNALVKAGVVMRAVGS